MNPACHTRSRWLVSEGRERGGERERGGREGGRETEIGGRETERGGERDREEEQ